MFKNRQGKFKIDQDFISREPDLVKKIMGKCVILRAESMLINFSVEYYALSDEFDEIPMGHVVPTYRAIVHGKDSELIKFERID